MAEPIFKFSYHGTQQISDNLSIPALDKQIQLLDAFDDIFQEEMRPAVGDALAISGARAKNLAPVLTGVLQGAIYGKLFGIGKNKTYVTGAVGVRKEIGVRGMVAEVGRWRGGKHGAERRWWKGDFFLYYGVSENRTLINALYQVANERIVNRLVVK
jgi:hypothetical protein